MPIYEYLCETCDHKFEVQQKFSDPPLDSCIKCGKTVRKLISAPGIMFKGTGWYVTDYSDKLKDPKQSSPSTDKEGSKDKTNGGGESGESKKGPEAGSSAQTSSSESGSSGQSKDSGTSPSQTSSPSTSSSKPSGKPSGS